MTERGSRVSTVTSYETGSRKPEGQELPDVHSIDDLAQACAQELRGLDIEPSLLQLLNNLEAITQLEGVALVASQKQHLSIYAFTELNRDNPESVETIASIGTLCGNFDEAIRNIDSSLSSSLSFFTTRGVGIASLIPKLTKEWGAEDTTSFIAFVTKG